MRGRWLVTPFIHPCNLAMHVCELVPQNHCFTWLFVSSHKALYWIASLNAYFPTFINIIVEPMPLYVVYHCFNISCIVTIEVDIMYDQIGKGTIILT